MVEESERPQTCSTKCQGAKEKRKHQWPVAHMSEAQRKESQRSAERERETKREKETERRERGKFHIHQLS